MSFMHQDVVISLSVVSHEQMSLVLDLLGDVGLHCQSERLEVLLTMNVGAEALPALDDFPFPVRVVRNSVPKGFGANHNQASALARGKYFCVANPDIRLTSNPFPVLISALAAPEIGVAAPCVLDVDGQTEDSARRFPSPLDIFKKALRLGGRGTYRVTDQPIYPDWAGGMFLLFPREAFAAVRGFDTRYFLYYEDVDLCARLRLAGYRVLVTPAATVVHAARRDSHRKWRYLRWHLASMLRFFGSAVYWKVRA